MHCYVFVPIYSSETERVFDKVQEFITSLSNFTDSENQRLNEEVSTNHVQSHCQCRFTYILIMARKSPVHLTCLSEN